MLLRGALVLFVLPVIALGEAPRRLGDDGFRVGQWYREAILSPDGRVFAVAGEFPDLFLLDATGGIVHHWELPAPAVGLAFTPDGQLVALDELGWARWFDPDSGRRGRELLVHPATLAAPLPGMLFEGGRLAAVRGGTPEKPEVLLYDLHTGRPVPRLRPQQPELLRASPCGRFVLEVAGRALSVLDLDTGTVQRLDLPLQELRGIAFDGARRAVIALGAGRVLRFSLRTESVENIRLHDLNDRWNDAEAIFSPDARRVVLCRHAGDCDVGEWDLGSGRQVARWTAGPVPTDRVLWTRTGKILAWSSQGLRLRPFDLRTGLQAELKGHQLPPCALRFEGRELVSVDAGGRVCRWATETGRLLDERAAGTGLPVGFDGRGRLREVDATGIVSWYDLAAGRADPQAPVAGQFLMGELRWSCASDLSTVTDVDTGHVERVPADVRTWLTYAPGVPWAVTTPDGKRLALGVRIPTSAGARLRFTLLGAPGPRNRWELPVATVMPPVLSPDGRLLAVCHDGKLTLFEAGLSPQTWPLAAAVAPLAFTPDGRHLVVEMAGPLSHELLVLDLASRTARQRWSARGLLTFRATVSPDGRTLAVPAVDGTVALLPLDLAPQPHLDPATLWRDLAARDVGVGNAALQALAARPEARREMAARHLTERAAEVPDLARVLVELDDDDPDRRTLAQQQLRLVPVAVLRNLAGATAEVRRAIRTAIEEADLVRDATPCELRLLRLAALRERLNSR